MRRGKHGEAFKFLVKARREDGLEGEAQTRLEWELGRCWVKLGYIENAIESYENALPDSHEDALYPWQAGAYEELAALYETGEEALRCCRNAARLRERFELPEDENTVSLFRNIADMLWDDGEEDEARVWYNKEMAVRDRLLPEEVDALGKQLIEQGKALMENKQYEQAVKEFTKALDILVPFIGMLHSRVIAILNNLAEVYTQIALQHIQNDIAEYHRFMFLTVDCFEKALEAKNRLFHDCMSTAHTHRNLGEALDRCSSLDISTIGEVNGLVVSVKENDRAILVRAIPHLKVALQIIHKNADENMVMIADTRRKLGNVFCGLGNYEEAIAELREACSYYQKAQVDSELALTYSFLANTYLKMQNYTEGLNWYFMAWQLLGKLEFSGMADHVFDRIKRTYRETAQARERQKPFEEWLREKQAEADAHGGAEAG